MVKKTKTSSNRRSKGKVNTDSGDDDDDDDVVVVIKQSYRNHNNDDGSESYTNDSHIGGGGIFSIGGGSDTLCDDEDDFHYNMHINNDDNDDDDDDNMDRIIQRGGDPCGGNDDSLAIRTTNRLQTIRDMIICVSDTTQSNRQHEVYIRQCYKVLALYGSSCGRMVYNDILSSNIDGIIDGCLYGLQSSSRSSSSSSKQYATCRLIEVVSILLCNYNGGCMMDHWMTSIQESLRRMILTNTTRSTTVRMAALRAISITIYMAHTVIHQNNNSNNNNDDDGAMIESYLDLCEILATNDQYRNQIIPLNLRATAYHCWTLLASTLDDYTIAGQDITFIGRGVAILIPIQQALDEMKSDAMGLRIAAAECVSLIHEARIQLGVINDTTIIENNNDTIDVVNDSVCDYYYDHEHIQLKGKSSTIMNSNATGGSRRYQKGTWDGSKQETLMDEVKQRVAELANESSHKISKKDKREQHSNFREYMTTLVDDESPELVIKLRNNSGRLELTSWKEIVPLNCIRNILQSGFQTQLLSNPVIQQLFHIQVGLHDSKYNGNMSQIEKRLLQSKNSESYKNADQDRHKKRDKRQNIKNHFLTADGDDL